MAKYTLILRRSAEPNKFGEYDELVLKNVLGEEIPRKEDILDSEGIRSYIQKQDRIENTHHARYLTYFGDSKFIVKNIEHFLTDNNQGLEAKTVVTAVRKDKSL